MTEERRRVLVLVGLLAAVGLLLAVLTVGGGGDTAVDEPADVDAVPPPSTSVAPTAEASTTTGAPTDLDEPAESVEEFVVEYFTALRTGDAGYLGERLDPAVLARYGDAACATYVASLADPTAQAEITAIGPATSFTYSSDGRATEIAGATTVGLDQVRLGVRRTATIVVHPVETRLHWFADCGTPAPG